MRDAKLQGILTELQQLSVLLDAAVAEGDWQQALENDERRRGLLQLLFSQQAGSLTPNDHEQLLGLHQQLVDCGEQLQRQRNELMQELSEFQSHQSAAQSYLDHQ